MGLGDDLRTRWVLANRRKKEGKMKKSLWDWQGMFSSRAHSSHEIRSTQLFLGQANKINCFSGIFLRKTHAGCGFFFFFCKPQPQLVSDQKPQASHSRE